MLAEVAHELNNPLAVVTAQAELLAETANDQETLRRAEKILRPAKRCAVIVRKFLSLTRQRKIEKTVLDVRRLINDAIDLLSYQLSKRSIVVHKKIDVDVPKLWGDGPQLSQVLINLLINAQQALSGFDSVRELYIQASSATGNNKVKIIVADNGPGIPESIRDKVLQPFFTTKPEGRGTGLGLSFCKSVIEAHAGSITIENAIPHGTKIIIELPGTNRSELDVSVRAHLAPTQSSLRVLVVDDEESLASSIAEVLEKYGHRATTACSAAQAMSLLESESFDIILADIHMPVTDGMAFYHNVMNFEPELAEKMIFITGDSLDQKLLEFFDEHRRPYLNKPFEIGELIRAVEHLALSPTAFPSANRSSEDHKYV